MKKLSILLLMLTMWAVSSPPADARRTSTQRIGTVVSEYNGKDGFEVVKIGSLLTSMLRGAVLNEGAASGGADAAKVLKTFNGIKKMTVVDYEDASAADKNSFNTSVNRLFEGTDMLMEAKDEDTTMRIFGDLDEAANRVQDLVMFCPEESILIYFTGSISLDDLAGVMNK